MLFILIFPRLLIRSINLALSKIRSLILTWIKSFLTGRMQTVIVDGVPSNSEPVISGVRLGSVLGPLIFLILIGDIDYNVQHSSPRSFTDDTRLIVYLDAFASKDYAKYVK